MIQNGDFPPMGSESVKKSPTKTQRWVSADAWILTEWIYSGCNPPKKKQPSGCYPPWNPGTNIVTPENGWLEYDRFLLKWPIFRDYVSFREGIGFKKQNIMYRFACDNLMKEHADNFFTNTP